MPADFAMAELNFPDREDSIVISESAISYLEDLCETYVTAAQCDNTDDEEETNAGWFLLNSLVRMSPAHKIDFSSYVLFLQLQKGGNRRSICLAN